MYPPLLICHWCALICCTWAKQLIVTRENHEAKGLLVLPVLEVKARLLCPDKMTAINIMREERLIWVVDSVCGEETLLLCPWGEIHHFGENGGANMLTSWHTRRKVQEEVRKGISKDSP